MTPRILTPRVLPVTIVAIALLSVVKSFSLVRHAVASDATATVAHAPQPAGSQAQKPVASPRAANPGQPARDGAGQLPACENLPAAPPITDSERALLLDLRARRSALDDHEAALRSREQVMDAVERRLSVRVGELTELEKKAEALEAARKQQEAANWQGLVKVYEGMKPRDAAAIFNDLDMPVLLEVVDRMKESKAATILAGMQPDRARQVTIDLAQKRLRLTKLPGPDVGRTGG